MCKKEKVDIASAADVGEQTSYSKSEDITKSELYKKAWLENDIGISSEFCQNTTSWD